jgi:hypothetical protein
MALIIGLHLKGPSFFDYRTQMVCRKSISFSLRALRFIVTSHTGTRRERS